MKNAWRFLLGGAIGLGLGYALVLLAGPSSRRPKQPLRPAAARPARERQPLPAGRRT